VSLAVLTAPGFPVRAHAGMISTQAAIDAQAAAGRNAEAEAAYREVLRVQSVYLLARNNLALLLAHRGCIAAATAVLAPARAAAGPECRED